MGRKRNFQKVESTFWAFARVRYLSWFLALFPCYSCRNSARLSLESSNRIQVHVEVVPAQAGQGLSVLLSAWLSRGLIAVDARMGTATACFLAMHDACRLDYVLLHGQTLSVKYCSVSGGKHSILQPAEVRHVMKKLPSRTVFSVSV